MKSKQYLDGFQMRNLQGLGLDINDSSVVFDKHESFSETGWTPCFRGYETHGIEQIPTYTLQDILDKLPKKITYNDMDYYLMLSFPEEESNLPGNIRYKELSKFGAAGGAIMKYFNPQNELDESPITTTHLIDAAYDLLCWYLENKQSINIKK